MTNIEKKFLICPHCDIYQEVNMSTDNLGKPTWLSFTICKHTIFKQSLIDRCLNDGHEPEIIKLEKKK